MKLVAGLGNPGSRYRGTRHNVGFDVVEEVARRHGAAWVTGPADALQAQWRSGADTVWLVKPLTFMNLSGEAIAALCRYFKVLPADVLVVCDDVNLPAGRLRVRGRGSDGGHNGLKSVAQHLGTTEYPRLRIGVGRGDMRRELVSHVLGGFAPEEQAGMHDAMTRSADAVELWMARGIEPVMNTYNRDPEAT